MNSYSHSSSGLLSAAALPRCLRNTVSSDTILLCFFSLQTLLLWKTLKLVYSGHSLVLSSQGCDGQLFGYPWLAALVPAPRQCAFTEPWLPATRPICWADSLPVSKSVRQGCRCQENENREGQPVACCQQSPSSKGLLLWGCHCCQLPACRRSHKPTSAHHREDTRSGGDEGRDLG